MLSISIIITLFLKFVERIMENAVLRRNCLEDYGINVKNTTIKTYANYISFSNRLNDINGVI